MNEENKLEQIAAPEQTKENKKAGKKIAIFLGALGLIGLVYGVYWETYASHYEETENAYVNANQNVVTSQIAGNIIQINVQDTQHVQMGEPLIRIENVDYQLALDRAKNDLARAVRNVNSLKTNESESLENLKSKQLDLKKAQDDYQRDEKAHSAGILSDEQLENSHHVLEQMTLALANAKTSLENAKVQAVSKTIQDHPDVAKAINAYKQAAIDLQRTQIIAPSSGIIAKKAVYIGQRVAPNQQLLTVIDNQGEWIDANFKESQLKQLKEGQEVELTSDVNGKNYTGYIAGIGAGSGSALSLLPAQNATGNWIKIVQRVPVRINILSQSLKENGLLPIGTSITAKVNLQKTLNEKKQEEKANLLSYDEEKINKEVSKIIHDNMSGVK